MKNYSVFCVAMAMPKEVQDSQSLDLWWDEASRLYEEFTDSPYNVDTRSEIDCINDFVHAYYRNYEIISKYKAKATEYVHRINMIKDDIVCIKKFIYEEGIQDVFYKQTDKASECFQHFMNIEVACDLDNDECFSWRPYFANV
jgi:hypothetical protein